MVIVSVVIPTRGGRRFLARSLPALAATRLPPGARLEVLVVASGPDGGTAALARAFPGVRVLASPRPLGFAAANDHARAHARGDVVAFLNDDTEPDPAWLLRPLAILGGDRGVAAVGSKLLFLHRFAPVRIAAPGRGAVFVADGAFGGPLDGKLRWAPGSPEPGGHAGIPGRWVESAILHVPVPIPDLDAPARDPVLRLLAARGPPGPVSVTAGERRLRLAELPGIVPLPLPARGTVDLVQNAGSFLGPQGDGGDHGAGQPDGPDFGREERVASLCGAALIVRRTDLDAVGWFPRAYTMYYEDTDLALRLRARGALVFCPASVVRHYHTGTSREGSPEFQEHVARSHLLFVARHAPARVALRAGARRIREAVRELRAKGLLEVLGAPHAARGTLRALLALPPVLRERLAAEASIGPLALPRQPYRPAPAEAAPVPASGPGQVPAGLA